MFVACLRNDIDALTHPLDGMLNGFWLAYPQYRYGKCWECVVAMLAATQWLHV